MAVRSIGSCLVVALVFAAGTSSAQTIVEDEDSCQSIQGEWWPFAKGQQFATCKISSSYTISSGVTLSIGPGIEVLLENNSTLFVEGRLEVIGTGSFIVSGGYIYNTGIVSVASRAELQINVGHVSNIHEFVNKGVMSVSDQGPQQVGFYNSGTFRNDGVASLHGNFKGSRGARTIVEAGAQLENWKTFIVDDLHIFGLFVNKASGVIRNDHTIVTDRGGRLENHGVININNQGTLRNRSTLVNDNEIQVISGTLISFGSLTNTAVIENAGGFLQNQNGAALENQGQIVNRHSATMDNIGAIINPGTIAIGCLSRLRTYGSIVGNRPSICHLRPPFSPPPALP